VTAMSYASSLSIKRKIKINKRKRKMLVSKAFHNIMRTRVKGNDNMIGYTAIVSISTPCSKCHILA